MRSKKLTELTDPALEVAREAEVLAAGTPGDTGAVLALAVLYFCSCQKRPRQALAELIQELRDCAAQMPESFPASEPAS